MTEIRSNFAAASVVVGLTGLAGYLAPAPPDAEIVFNLTAVGSGLAGYWIGTGDAARAAAVRWRFVLGVVAVIVLPMLAYEYWTYFQAPSPDIIRDIFSFWSFSVLFATITFFLGVLKIDVLGSNE